MRSWTNSIVLFGVCGLLGSAIPAAEAAVIANYNTSNTTGNSSQWQVGGALAYVGFGGQIGYFNGEAYSPTAGQQAGRNGNQIGYLLTDNPTGTYSAASPQRLATINSFTITGSESLSGRQGLEQITVYYGNNQSQSITLPATPGSQTHTFSTPITTSYLYWTNALGVQATIDGRYVSEFGYGGNPDSPFDGITFNGSWGASLNNVNATATMSNTGVTFGVDTRAVDGTVFFNGTNTGVFWTRNDATADSLTATYSSAQTIGSIGLGLNLDTIRAQPGQVTVSYDGGSEVINLRGDNLNYGVYDLAAPITTSFLTLTFPDGASTSGWFNPNNEQTYGITEFQAFEAVVIPEPASLGLLSLGSLLISMRQRRRA